MPGSANILCMWRIASSMSLTLASSVMTIAMRHRLALLTLLALDFVRLYLSSVVIHISPFPSLPLQRFAVLNLTQIVNSNPEVFGYFLRTHFYHAGASTFSSMYFVFAACDLAILAISVPVISSPVTVFPSLFV